MSEYETNDVTYDELSTFQCIYYVANEQQELIFYNNIPISQPLSYAMVLIQRSDKK